MTKEMEEKEVKVNESLKRYSTNDIVFANLNVLYNMACNLNNGLYKYFTKNREPIDYSQISRASITEKINIIKNFYHKMGIEFNFDTALKNGTIRLYKYDTTNDSEDLKEGKIVYMFAGINIYKESQKIINIPNLDLITDAIITVHELSHLRDQPDNHRNQVNDLLTESLAYAEELIFMDYLAAMGYQKEIDFFKEELYRMCYYQANITIPIYEMFLVYQKYGLVTKENYEHCFNNKEYEKEIDRFIKEINDPDFNFIRDSWFIMGIVLGSFMYTEYRKDNQYFKVIQTLHDKINHSNENGCLKEMGLNGFGEETVAKLNMALNEIQKELDEIMNKESKIILKK